MKKPLFALVLASCLSLSGCGGPAVTEDGFTEAGSNLWSGVKIYYGPSHSYVFDVVGGNEQHRTLSGETIRGLKVRYPNGNEEYKDRSNIVTSGEYFVRADDPAITAQRWEVFTD